MTWKSLSWLLMKLMLLVSYWQNSHSLSTLYFTPIFSLCQSASLVTFISTKIVWKDPQCLLKDFSCFQHALKQVLNFANSLSTACLRSFMLSRAEWDHTTMQAAVPWHFLSFSSFGQDRTINKVWATHELHRHEALCYNSQNVVLYLARANTFTYCFLWKLGFSLCNKTCTALEYFRGLITAYSGVHWCTSWLGHPECWISQQAFPAQNQHHWRLQCSGTYIFIGYWVR